MIRSWWLFLTVLLSLISGVSFSRSSDDDPTYSETIRPMLARSCVPCHHPEGEAPFPLTTYAEVKKRAALLRWVCIVGTMPPVDADGDLAPYSAVAKLSDIDLLDLQEWVRTGAKEGKHTPESTAPLPPWRLQKPTTNLISENPGTISAEGAPIRKLFVLKGDTLPTGCITGFSIVGASKLALRQAYLAVVPDNVDPQDLFPQTGMDARALVGAWTPGHFAWKSATGVHVDKGSRLAVWALFQPTGKPESASFTLELSLGPDQRGSEWHTLGNKEFAIKPSDGLETLTDEWTLSENRTLTAIIPECKLYAQQVRVKATFPNGDTKTLLSVRTWDRNWVGAYNPERAIPLPKGTKVVAEIDYDNSGHSAGNREARPTTSIKFGASDKDEHFWVHLQTIPGVP